MIDPELVRRVREGAYVVDPEAVAGAILSRRSEAGRLSRVLVAAQRERSAVRPDERRSGAGADLA